MQRPPAAFVISAIKTTVSLEGMLLESKNIDRKSCTVSLITLRRIVLKANREIVQNQKRRGGVSSALSWNSGAQPVWTFSLPVPAAFWRQKFNPTTSALNFLCVVIKKLTAEPVPNCATAAGETSTCEPTTSAATG